MREGNITSLFAFYSEESFCKILQKIKKRPHYTGKRWEKQWKSVGKVCLGREK